MINKLPPPPPGRSGWPWTEESPPVSGNADAWPIITVVTPSYNQGRFLEATIRSVLLQNYPRLEYIVLDGGSTDETVEIIRRYSRWITFWTSEPDGGQSDAINRGMERGSGQIATWINSDDMLCRNALISHVERHGHSPDVAFVGICHHIDETGLRLNDHQGFVRTFEDLVRIRRFWRKNGFIDQPAVLFPREAFLKSGGLDVSNHRTMDYELWGMMLLQGVRFEYTGIPIGMFRVHSAQKTMDGAAQTQALIESAKKLIAFPNNLTLSEKSGLFADLDAYHREFCRKSWKSTGRLAQWGLPPRIVKEIRNWRNRAHS
jgi:glycosyltransferase involved in cell wall biosynthesis